MVLQQELLLKEVLTRKGISEPELAAASIEAVTPIELPNSDALAPLNDLLVSAMKQRPDLAIAEEQIDSTRTSLKGSRNELLPQFSIVASMQNNGGAGKGVTAGGNNSGDCDNADTTEPSWRVWCCAGPGLQT